jgi:endonuclease/exonuclease/phosphatase family metal-dependent hydrolase
VASANLHGGVRPDGAPYDVAAAVAGLDADLVALQEVWWPEGACAPVDVLGRALGGTGYWALVGAGTQWRPGDRPGRGGLGAAPVRLDNPRPAGRRAGCHPRPAGQPAPSGPRGVMGTVVVSRLPVLRSTLDLLPPLRRDQAQRSLLLVTVAVGGTEVTVAATHMAHLSQGSLRHFRAVGRRLAPAGSGPGVAAEVLLGDLNLWGVAVPGLLPGWRRAVVGRTWPARWPIVQPDHVLVRGRLAVSVGEVLPPSGSDHRAVRARLHLRR